MAKIVDLNGELLSSTGAEEAESEGVETQPVLIHTSVLEVAVHLIQYNLLSGERIEPIWSSIEFEMASDAAGNLVVGAGDAAFDVLQKLFNDPENQRKFDQQMKNVIEQQVRAGLISEEQVQAYLSASENSEATE